MCTENLARFDLTTESLNVSHDYRADIPLVEPGCLADVPRVVALIVAIAQAAYAFAPAAFGLIRQFQSGTVGVAPIAAPNLFLAAALLQGLAIAAFLAGRQGSIT